MKIQNINSKKVYSKVNFKKTTTPTTVSNAKFSDVLSNRYGKTIQKPYKDKDGFESIVFLKDDNTPKAEWRDVTTDGRYIYINTGIYFNQRNESGISVIRNMVTDFPISNIRR